MADIIVGNYRLIKRIGEGGCAYTYLAEHLVLGEKACLKQSRDTRPAFTKALLAEAKLLWQIHHHSLPTLRDVIKLDDGAYMLAMTFIEGKDMHKAIVQDFPNGLHPEHVCWITQRLLNALYYLHSHGIIHCDVKPQNIMLKPKEHNAVLVDYGISCARPSKYTEPTGHTPDFAAPELVAGKPPIPETDIYGLGASMLFALGGDVSAKTFPKDTPKELQEFFGKMLCFNPKDRPNDCNALIEPLVQIRKKLFGKTSSGRELVLS